MNTNREASVLPQRSAGASTSSHASTCSGITPRVLRTTTRALAIASSLCAASSAGAQNTTSHLVTVGSWFDDGTGGGGTSTSFGDADADAVFAATNAIVTLSDQMGDVVCNHSMGRSGSVVGISGNQSDGDINSQAEFDYVDRAPTFVKVVPIISFCAGTFMNAVGGCTTMNSLNSIVLAEWAIKGHPAGGVVTAHEYGHAVNLDHEANQLFNFMIDFSTPENRNVNATQCPSLQSNAIDSNGPSPASGLVFSSASLPTMRPQATYTVDLSAATPTIEQLAQTVFLHIPLYLEHQQRGAGDLQALLDTLRNGTAEWFEPTIAMLVGILSGERAEESASVLIDFAETHYGTAAARAAIGSLGHLAERGSTLALNRLIDYVADPNGYFTASAVVGLGLSGRTEAHAVLQGLLPATTAAATSGAAQVSFGARPVPTYSGAAPSKLQRETVETAIVANEIIATSGRDGYYAQ